MTYNYIINHDKLDAVKKNLGIMTNPSFFAFMQDRLERYLVQFKTIQSLKFSGKRIGSGRQLTLDLKDDSELEGILEALDGFTK